MCWLFLEGSLFHLFLSWPLFLDRQEEGSQWREGCRTLVCVRCRLRICAGMGSPLFGSGCTAAQLCWRWRFCVSVCFAAQLCWDGQECSEVCAAQRVVVLLRIRAGGLSFAVVRRFGFSFPCRLERRWNTVVLRRCRFLHSRFTGTLPYIFLLLRHFYSLLRGAVPCPFHILKSFKHSCLRGHTP